MNTCSFDLSASQLENKYVDTLDVDVIDALKKRGRLFSSTGLNFTLRRAILMKLKHSLTEDISKEESNQTTSYKITLNVINENNHPFLKINVSKYRALTLLGTVYEGIFFSWTENDTSVDTNLNLPFLYCIGNQKIVSLVNKLIEKNLGCVITPIIFTQVQFKWLLVLALEHILHIPKDIQLVYQIPNLSDANFTFHVHFDILKENWQYIHDEDSGKINYEEVARFHTSLEEHVKNTFGFDLSRFHFKMVSIPQYFTLNESGKVEILRIELIDIFYRFVKDRLLLESM